VQRQTREIGVRIALGAERFDVLWLTLSRGMRVTALGLALGAGAARAGSRFLAAQLYGISTTDLTTFILMPAILVLATGAASYLPARRACRIDPAQALRYD